MSKDTIIELTPRELYYVNQLGHENLYLEEVAKVIRTPSYSKMSKDVSNLGYELAEKSGKIPHYNKKGKKYLYHIRDVLTFMDSNNNGSK